MKKINQYINEHLKISQNSNIKKYNYHPKDKKELQDIINKLINERGPGADLNDIDTRAIHDMSEIFYNTNFQGDISEWDTSNVIYMGDMFHWCIFFNCDISHWDVSNVKYMAGMFYCCDKFNQNIGSWDVSNVRNMDEMFKDCKEFNQDLSNWNVSKLKYMDKMFDGCDSMKNIPSWYKTNNN